MSLKKRLARMKMFSDASGLQYVGFPHCFCILKVAVVSAPTLLRITTVLAVFEIRYNGKYSKDVYKINLDF